MKCENEEKYSIFIVNRGVFLLFLLAIYECHPLNLRFQMLPLQRGNNWLQSLSVTWASSKLRCNELFVLSGTMGSLWCR